jgi:hypothetical protein
MNGLGVWEVWEVGTLKVWDELILWHIWPSAPQNVLILWRTKPDAPQNIQCTTELVEPMIGAGMEWAPPKFYGAWPSDVP